MVLTSFFCNIEVEMSMWNFNWWSYADVYFCWSPTYVYAYNTDCSNWGVYPGESLNITWCGTGARGYRADGGDNVTISPFFGGGYGAGQRASLDIHGVVGFSCWNAHC